ncbi:MAG: asparaginase domain-containing protein [Candidatus Micrarchaeia archaeon]
MEHRKVAIITTGGTISSVSSENGIKPSEGVIKLILEKLSYNMNTLISKDGKTKVNIIPLFNKDSTNITLADQANIAKTVYNSLTDADGIVITHGTDTLQFTSSILSLMVQNPNKPVVITGSMQTIESEKTDAYSNISDALKFAVGGINGVFVAFHKRIMAASWVYETKGSNGLTFKSILGDIANITKDENIIYRVSKYQKAKTINSSILQINYDDKIGTFTLSPNENNETLLETSQKSDGIILLSYGSAGIPERNFNIIRSISKRIPIVLSSQVPSIRTDFGNYEISILAKKAGVIIGTGLYSFDYSNMALSLANSEYKNASTEKERENKLNKFEEVFNKNRDRVLFEQSYSYRKILDVIKDGTNTNHHATTPTHKKVSKSLYRVSNKVVNIN